MAKQFFRNPNPGIKRRIRIGLLMGVSATATFFGQATQGAANSKIEDVLPGAAYDVATIKPHNPALNGSYRMLPNGGFIATGTTLQNLACTAYSKFSFQISGGPAWFDSDQFDVEAKPDGALSDQLQKLSPDQLWRVQARMLQALLEDRLKLKVHRETREMPVFALVVAKDEPKLHEAKSSDTYHNGIKGPDGQEAGSGSMMVGNGKMIFQGYSMDGLANQLGWTINHIVSDNTGLKGIYDFTLRYSDDELSAADSSRPSIYTALQEQLGLKLESIKGPVEVVVVDHVERPSGN